MLLGGGEGKSVTMGTIVTHGIKVWDKQKFRGAGRRIAG